MDVAVTVLRVGVGIFLIGAALLKMRHGLDRFAAAILAYELIRGRPVRIIARVVPAVELLLGAALVADALTTFAAAVAAALIGAFTVAVAVRMLQGRRHVCGCGGALEARIGPRVLARNTVLLVVLVVVSLSIANGEM